MKTSHTATLALSLAATLLLVTASLARAQSETADAKPKAQSAASKAAAKKKPEVSADRTNLKTSAKNVAAGIVAAEDALTPDELAIAERVQVGKLPCELGASVTLTADGKAPGYFDIQGKNFKYRMFPVPTTTGAIRLEDRKAGAVWLQLANKSMLMNQKLGIRLADECVSPEQVAIAENMKLNPPASVLDAPRSAAAAVPSPAGK